MRSLSRLIRLPNILMVVLTMYLMRWSIVRPILDLLGFDPAMPEWSFGLLVLSTALITAAGNVINDFHDIKADRVNHPERVVIDRFVSRRQAIMSHLILNVVGVVLGVFISIYHWIPWLGLIFFSVPFILWLYSISFKHQPLIGNLVVSVLAATVPLLVILFEYPLLVEQHAAAINRQPDLFVPLIYWVGIFSGFAFIINLIRELVKDGEDVEGDLEMGSKTLAILVGKKILKVIVSLLLVLALIALGCIFFLFLPDQVSLVYFVLFLALPIAYMIFLVSKVQQPADWHSVSLLSKLLMLFGLLYAPIAFLLLDSLSKMV